MITITNLSGIHSETVEPQVHATAPVVNTQSKKKFWRRMLHSKNLITAQSSTGGEAQISTDELWNLMVAADPKLAAPEDIKPTLKK